MNAVVRNKLEAADRFVARLVASPAGKHIAKVILHGSVAEGTARPESDVDLLVFHLGEAELVADFCDEMSFETLMETTEIVEPLVFLWNDYRYPPS
ncbi:MAG TPA: nucleotidyltransferase domain-containing protein [Anaerolineae bacterium]|nr:nucleotidyltransferase domain-containing protein [Anaerolineae bacterium]